MLLKSAALSMHLWLEEFFSEVKKTITKDELLANKEFICASEDSEILIDFGGYRRETLDCYVTVDDSCINIIEL